jgi:cytochrome b561
MMRNTALSCGSVSRWFHWIVAAAIIGMIAYGWWMNHFPDRADRFFYRSIHADIG